MDTNTHLDPGWNHRPILIPHQIQLARLFDFHTITLNCLKDLGAAYEKSRVGLERVNTPGIRETIEKIENFTSDSLQFDFHNWMEIQTPADFIQELGMTLRRLQLWEILGAMDRTAEDERPYIREQLVQSCFVQGMSYGQKRLPLARGMATSEIQNLFRTSPIHIGHPKHKPPLLPLRQSTHFVDFQWLGCNHNFPPADLVVHADLLCDLHFSWLRGLLYEVRPDLKAVHTLGPNCCRIAISVREN